MAPILDEKSNPDLTRRGLLLGTVASLMCSPAIVRSSSIMQVRPELILRRVSVIGLQQAGFVDRVYFDGLARSLLAGRQFRNGDTLVSTENARHAVARAKQCGFLAPSIASAIRLVG